MRSRTNPNLEEQHWAKGDIGDSAADWWVVLFDWEPAEGAEAQVELEAIPRDPQLEAQ